MNRILSAAAITSSLLVGCQGVPESPSAPALAIKATPTPKAGTEISDQAYRLPGMDCLVNEHGIRVKVQPVRPGVCPTDKVPDGKVTGEALRTFQPYYVFDTSPHKGTPRYYQIGKSPRRESLLGWVHANGVARWDTRVGERLRRVPGTPLPPLLVFGDKAPLVELIRTGSTAVEPIARPTWTAERAQMPWPVAEFAQVTVEGQTHELVRLNFLAEFRDGTTQATGTIVPVDWTQVQTGIRMIDLVFVLDVTGSMGPYIAATRSTVAAITEGVRRLPGQPDVALGLVAYRDHDSNSGFVTRPIDLDTNFDRFTANIATLQASAGGDAAEAVYDGLDDALEKITWRGNGLSARVIVLIGDASAHEPGDAQNPKGLSRDSLVEKAQRHRVKICTLAAADPNANADRKRQQEQFRDLAARTGGTTATIDRASVVIDHIKGLLAATSQEVEVRGEVVKGLKEGKSPGDISASEGIELRKVTEVMEFLKGAGIPVGPASAGMPQFATGWALSEFRGVPLLEREVHLAREELEVLVSGLSTLCVRLTPKFGEQIFEVGTGGRINPMESFLKGDLPDTMDVFLMAKGVPVGRSSILRMTPADVRHMPEARRLELRDRIIRSILPELLRVRNQNDLWSYRDSVEFGWIPERLLP